MSPLNLDTPSTLSRTLDATLHLGKQVELEVLLRLVVEVARSLCGAGFGAIWVLDQRRTMLSEFIHTGRRFDGDVGEAIGRIPSDGRWHAGFPSDPVLVRLVQLDLEDCAYGNGCPAADPDTVPFLRFPIDVHGLCSGSLYLTEKNRSAEFTHDDEVTATVLSMAAGIAVENARRFEQG
jgi:GAF domain-containing protein